MWLLLIILSVLWGGSFFFGKVAIGELPPFTVVFGRVSIAALALILVVTATGSRIPCSGRTWVDFLIMGMLNNAVPFSLILWGQTQIGSGLASILNGTTPMFTIVLAHFIRGGETLSANRIGGVLLGLTGIVVVIGPGVISGLGTNAAAQLAIVGAALSFALADIFGRRFRDLSPAITATGQLTASSAVMLPVMLVVDRPWTIEAPGLDTWASLAGLAILSTALAYVIYFRILAAAGATNVLLVTFLIPVSALLLGMTFLGERLDPAAVGGMVLIAFGLVMVDGRVMRRVVHILAPGAPDRVADAVSERKTARGSSR